MRTLLLSLLCFILLLLAACDPGGELTSTDPAEHPPEETLRTTFGDDDDDCGCTDIEATLVSVLGPDFTTAGVIDGDLEGTTAFAGALASEAPIIAAPPTFPYTGGLTVTTEDGTLTTSGAGVFELGPFGIGTQVDRITGGTGDFAGATGSLYYNFIGNAAGDGFTSAVTGELCLPCPDDDDEDDDDDDD